MNKRKMSLLATLGVSLFAVVAASVSTYAWFQATASAVISSSTSSTTITVSKPDDFAFYGYRHNGLSTYGTVTNHGASNSDFLADFETITDGNLSAKTTFNSIYPGQSFVFCLFANNLSEGDDVYLLLDSLISNDAIKQGESYHRYYYGSDDVDINIGWAIDIYTMNNDDGTGYESFLTSTSYDDQFDYNYSASFDNDSNKDPLSASGEIEYDPGMEIFHEQVGADETCMYVFYRVYFVNDQTSLFKEVNVSGNKIIGASPDNADRYFQAFRPRISTPLYLTGNFNSNRTTDLDYAMTKIDGTHYQIEGVNLSENDKFKIYNPTGPAYITNSETWTDCGFTLVNYNEQEKYIQVPSNGYYTIDYYSSPVTEGHYVTVTKTANNPIKDYDSNCYQGLSFAITSLSFTF